MLPSYFSLRKILFGVPYSSWSKRHFRLYIDRMPDSEEKRMMTELLRRAK